MLRDVATQLAVGAVRRAVDRADRKVLILPFTPTFSTERNMPLLALCVGVAERWLMQLVEAEVGSGGDDVATSCRRNGAGGRLSPSRQVVAVGGAAWDELFAHDTVEVLMEAITRTARPLASSGGDHGSEVDDGNGSSSTISTVSGLGGGSAAAEAALLVRARSALAGLAQSDRHAGLGDGGVWIVKPSGASCGKGIVVRRSLSAIAEAVAHLDFKAVVQKWATSFGTNTNKHKHRHIFAQNE
jgi:hypothetical protein